MKCKSCFLQIFSSIVVYYVVDWIDHFWTSKFSCRPDLGKIKKNRKDLAVDLGEDLYRFLFLKILNFFIKCLQFYLGYVGLGFKLIFPYIFYRVALKTINKP